MKSFNKLQKIIFAHNQRDKNSALMRNIFEDYILRRWVDKACKMSLLGWIRNCKIKTSTKKMDG